jgi:hypothetical protein
MAASEREPVVLEPERQDVAAGLALFNTGVAAAIAYESGVLRMSFDGGRRLTVEPHPRYEAWTVGPGSMVIVSPAAALSCPLTQRRLAWEAGEIIERDHESGCGAMRARRMAAQRHADTCAHVPTERAGWSSPAGSANGPARETGRD